MNYRTEFFYICIVCLLLIVAFFTVDAKYHSRSQPIMPPEAHTNDTASPSVATEDRSFRVQIADTPEKQSRGLMGVTELDPDEGMLFIFEHPSRRHFWNRNTLLHLYIIWIRDGIIVGIDDLPPESEVGTLVVDSPTDVDRVLELPLFAGLGDDLYVGAKLIMQP